MDELERLWLRLNAKVGALLISHYEPKVKVEEMPQEIDFVRVQQLVNLLLNKH